MATFRRLGCANRKLSCSVAGSRCPFPVEAIDFFNQAIETVDLSVQHSRIYFLVLDYSAPGSVVTPQPHPVR